MSEVNRLLAEVKETLRRKDETYRLVADCKPAQCDGCNTTGRVETLRYSRPCSFCNPYGYRAWRAKMMKETQ